MAKTIIISEQQAKTLFNNRIDEMTGDVTFGRDIYSAANLAALKSIPNNVFTNTKLENAYDEWVVSEKDSTTKEYGDFCNAMEYFMDVTLNGIIQSIENKRGRKAVPFHYLILDPQWMRLAIQGADRLRDTEGNEGKNTGFRCLYTLILTIYQNPAVWNDYCFNPTFEKYRTFVSSMVSQALNLDIKYKQIMPLKELKEINMFKADKSNENEKLWYNDDWRINVQAGQENEITDVDDFD